MKRTAIFIRVHRFLIDLLKPIIWAKQAGKIDESQYYALTMICAKMTRILNGKADFRDHWEDLANYALLGGRVVIPKEKTNND